MEKNQTEVFTGDVTVHNNIQKLVKNTVWIKKKHNSFYMIIHN